MRPLCVLAAGALAFTSHPAARAPGTGTPRTPWGDPDLQGCCTEDNHAITNILIGATFSS